MEVSRVEVNGVEAGRAGAEVETGTEAEETRDRAEIADAVKATGVKIAGTDAVFRLEAYITQMLLVTGSKFYFAAPHTADPFKDAELGQVKNTLNHTNLATPLTRASISNGGMAPWKRPKRPLKR